MKKYFILNLSGQKIFNDVAKDFVTDFLTTKGVLASLFTVYEIEDFQGHQIGGKNMNGEQFLASSPFNPSIK